MHKFDPRAYIVKKHVRRRRMEYLSDEERMRRAEEVSYRRQNRISVGEINSQAERKHFTRFGKLSLQIIVSICIFGVVYFVNENYSFAIEKIKPAMNKDTDFNKVYQTLNEVFSNIVKDDSNENMQDNQIAQNEISEQAENVEIQNENQEQAKDEGKTEADNESKEQQETSNESTEQSSQNEIIAEPEVEELSDAEYIKSNFSLIKPVEGVISSTFGSREATEVISANHQGIDIAVNTGTEVKAAMSGKVKEVSTYGDYGTHILMENQDVVTLYAHLSEALVSEGDEIEQGRIIAKTGSTGRSTGPHLHFEIRRNNIAINPQEVLDF